MLSPGLCSITFRKLTADEIISLAAGNGLTAIEWGGDIHVPVGRNDLAAEIGRRCADAGLATPSYGSYFRVTPDSRGSDFEPTLETARALGAETIRVWADQKSSREMDGDYFQRLADAGRRLGESASLAGARIAFEYHLGTATDTNASALRLVEMAGHPAVRLYWQPRQKTPVEGRLGGLHEIGPHLAHLHVFQWVGERDQRMPLADGAMDWKRYLACAAAIPGDRCAYWNSWRTIPWKHSSATRGRCGNFCWRRRRRIPPLPTGGHPDRRPSQSECFDEGEPGNEPKHPQSTVSPRASAEPSAKRKTPLAATAQNAAPRRRQPEINQTPNHPSNGGRASANKLFMASGSR